MNDHRTPVDTFSSVSEPSRPDYRTAIAQLREVGVSLHKLRSAAIKAAFSVLDLRLNETPEEDRPARSWEVEREEFIRRLERQQRSDDDA